MTKDKTVTMSRELEILEEINAAANRQACFEVQRLTDELRSLLAAPVVERKESYGFASVLIDTFQYAIDNGKQPTFSKGDLRYFIEQLGKCQNTSPPAPVAVALPDRRPEMDGWPYSWNACLDKVKEMNYQGHASDCSTNNRGVPELLGPCDCALSKKMP